MKEKTEDEFKIEIIYVAYWIIVIAAKIIRYTILKETLVDMSIGNGWISRLVQGGNSFMLNFNGVSVASENSIALFQVLKFLGLSTYKDFELVITIIWNILFFVILFSLKNRISLSQVILITTSIAVLNIWDFCLAKEPLQFLYFVAIYYILISKIIPQKLKYPLSLLVILFSTVSYRNYYILIIAFSVISFFLIEKIFIKAERITLFDFLVALLVFAVAYSIIVIAAKHFNQEAYNCFIYFNQRVTTATTDLSSIFHSNVLPIMALDYILLVIRMLFPVELMRFGLQYWIYAIYQIVTSIFIIRSLKNIKNSSRVKLYAIYIFIGFLFASATFEPDFGSWVRHEAVTIPIIFIICDMYDEKTNLMESEDKDEK